MHRSSMFAAVAPKVGQQSTPLTMCTEPDLQRARSSESGYAAVLGAALPGHFAGQCGSGQRHFGSPMVPGIRAAHDSDLLRRLTGPMVPAASFPPIVYEGARLCSPPPRASKRGASFAPLKT